MAKKKGEEEIPEAEPLRPEDVELTSGPPITFKEHLDVFGTPEAALSVMKQRAEAGHDWVAATYIDQIEYYIKEMMLEPDADVRSPVMGMLYEVEMEVADWINDAWSELEKEYGIEEVTVKGEAIVRLKGMPKEKQRAILKKKADELIQRFEELMLKRLGQDRYLSVQNIRRRVREMAAAPPPPMAMSKRKELEAKERRGELRQDIARLKRIIKELERELEEKVR